MLLCSECLEFECCCEELARRDAYELDGNTLKVRLTGEEEEILKRDEEVILEYVINEPGALIQSIVIMTDSQTYMLNPVARTLRAGDMYKIRFSVLAS
jgi:hypothetical protein